MINFYSYENPLKEIEDDYNHGGDLGQTAENILQKKIQTTFTSETITLENSFDLIADSIVCAISGLLPSNLIFFLGTPLEPPRAAIIQIGFI